MLTATLPDLNTLTLDALKALIVAQHERLLTREREVEHLQLLIARLQRMQFGRKSEKLAQQIEQLELRLEELQSEPVEDSVAEAKPSVLTNKDAASAKPARHPLPEHLPRGGTPERLVERVAGEAERRRRHAGAEDIETAHGDLETFAGCSDKVHERNAAGLESQPRQRMRRDDVDALGDFEARRSGIDHESRQAARAGRLAGAGEDDVEIGDAAV